MKKQIFLSHPVNQRHDALTLVKGFLPLGGSHKNFFSLFKNFNTAYCKILPARATKLFEYRLFPVNSLPSYHPTLISSARKIAFTLAEVLITLGIIGVVAAMTMPTLIQNHKTKETVSRVKKAYSVISNAYSLAKNEHGEFSEWGLQNSFVSSTVNEDENPNWREENAKYKDIFWNILGAQLNIVSRCKSSDPDCKDKYEAIYKLDGSPRNVSASDIYILNLNDGTTLQGGFVSNANCTKNQICADIAIDINGVKKGPNTLGKDIFYFEIYPDKISPMGATNSTSTNKFNITCKMTATDNNNNGYGCTAWVMYNENMDYLYCNDLSWDGKHKCH